MIEPLRIKAKILFHSKGHIIIRNDKLLLFSDWEIFQKLFILTWKISNWFQKH